MRESTWPLNRSRKDLKYELLAGRKRLAMSSRRMKEGTATVVPGWAQCEGKAAGSNLRCSPRALLSKAGVHVLKIVLGWAMLVHTFDASTWEAETGRFLSSRPAWLTE